MGDVVFSEFCGEIEISLTKWRSPAAAPIFRKRNFEPERFQHFYGSKADVRFVIAHKGIVPEDDFAFVVAAIGDRGSPRRSRHPRRAGVSDPGYSMPCKPPVESL